MKVKFLKVFAKIKGPERFSVLNEGLSKIRVSVGGERSGCVGGERLGWQCWGRSPIGAS